MQPEGIQIFKNQPKDKVLMKNIYVLQSVFIGNQQTRTEYFTSMKAAVKEMDIEMKENEAYDVEEVPTRDKKASRELRYSTKCTDKNYPLRKWISITRQNVRS